MGLNLGDKGSVSVWFNTSIEDTYYITHFFYIHFYLLFPIIMKIMFKIMFKSSSSYSISTHWLSFPMYNLSGLTSISCNYTVIK